MTKIVKILKIVRNQTSHAFSHPKVGPPYACGFLYACRVGIHSRDFPGAILHEGGTNRFPKVTFGFLAREGKGFCILGMGGQGNGKFQKRITLGPNYFFPTSYKIHQFLPFLRSATLIKIFSAFRAIFVVLTLHFPQLASSYGGILA